MRATAHRNGETFTHDVEIRAHHVTADEPEENGGDDSGPSPQELLAASLASCTAITIEMYARRKGWEIGDVAVGGDYQPPPRGGAPEVPLAVSAPQEPPEGERARLLQRGPQGP